MLSFKIRWGGAEEHSCFFFLSFIFLLLKTQLHHLGSEKLVQNSNLAPSKYRFRWMLFRQILFVCIRLGFNDIGHQILLCDTI